MFRLIFLFISVELMTCDEVISESVSGEETRHTGLNLQTMSDKVLSALHFIPNQATGTRETIMLNATSIEFKTDFEDFDRGLETRNCGIYDALLHRKKQVDYKNPYTNSPPPQYAPQYSNVQGFGQTTDQPSWRSQSRRDDTGNRLGSIKKKERKKTRAPGGFLFEDEKLAFHFCCCCCLAGLCNKIPYHPKEGGYDY